VVVKQEPISRENTPFLPVAPSSRHATPAVAPEKDRQSPVREARPITPLQTTELEIPCSQDTISTIPFDDPDTPLKAKVEDEESAPFPIAVGQDSSPANQGSRKRPGKRRKSGKPGLGQATSPVSNHSPSAQTTRVTKNLKSRGGKLTHANKAWLDMCTSNENESMESASVVNEPPPQQPAIPAHRSSDARYEHTFKYVKEILARSLSWSLVPIRWAAHCAAMYVLPFAIAVAVFSVILYMLLPSSIFGIIPSVFSTTTTILAFPARLVVSKGPQVWCGYVGLGCGRDDTEQEENFRNATFATDLEVRNAHTVITNLNQLNDSSLRLSLDSVITHLPCPTSSNASLGQHPLGRRRRITPVQLDRSSVHCPTILLPRLPILHPRPLRHKTRSQRQGRHGPYSQPIRPTLDQTRGFMGGEILL
jgi:hypothetical protein